jgi:hypothetical protein
MDQILTLRRGNLIVPSWLAMLQRRHHKNPRAMHT